MVKEVFMAVTSGFYNSFNHDRLYNADQFGSIFDGLIADGVYHNVGQAFMVSPGEGLNVNVGSGRGWFQHTWIYNDGVFPVPIGAPPVGGLKRIDTIVIGVNKNQSVRASSIYALEGTAAAKPSPRALSDGTNGLYEYALAFVTVESAVDTIQASKIKQVVGRPEEGGVPYVICPVATTQSLNAYFAAYEAKLETRINTFIASIQQDIGEDSQTTLANLASHVSSIDQTIGLDDTQGLRRRIVKLEDDVSGTDGITEQITGSGGINDQISSLRTLINTNSQTITGRIPTAASIDHPDHGIAISTPNSTGTKPTKLGGNSFVVITMNTDKTAKYNAQLAFGFDGDLKKPKIAIRVKQNSATISSTNPERRWGKWAYSGIFKA
jgi:hypothetical protein